ncbi:type II toxin-antitoxin system RelE/ParE family toxin [Glacieibacterium frigidum]|uniref:Type II toxin-antitoxin system RelE/ParE family toxin n=1 Tax=Glacieibacterium frigidum TaxID=2593303 RepID=A0A552UHC9_9SPHN|nr:type II toxin-antitoxin system RelE/ParE family toxin [Glacieibacterium frigidum]TRW17591.1 type II toxin-antitoxin system RelE/ParE family toxin [Glacieibacterium frigidum]
MKLIWTPEALEDVERLVDFLLPVAPAAAARVRERLTTAPQRLIDFPRIAAPLRKFAPAEIRRLIVGDYEVRYQLVEDVIRVLSVYHTREDRPFSPLD